MLAQNVRQKIGNVPANILDARLAHMDIEITPKTARERVLRIWLERVPESSDVVYAFRPDQKPDEDDPVAEAHIFGRGVGSDAMERVMLIFYLGTRDQDDAYVEGDVLRLLIRNEDGGYDDISLDVLEIE